MTTTMSRKRRLRHNAAVFDAIFPLDAIDNCPLTNHVKKLPDCEHYERRRRRIQQNRQTRIPLTVFIIALFGILSIIIHKSIAFVVVSPTKTIKHGYHPIGSVSQPSHSFAPPRIRQRRQIGSIILFSSNESRKNNDKKPEHGDKNSKQRKGNKKFKGGPKRKKSKSPSSPTSKNRKKDKPIDPSKAKKREIMDQIKAKIKEEEEQKKKKQTTNKKPKTDQQQRQKPKKASPNNDASAQTRLQKISEEDDSIDDDLVEDNADESETSEKRKKLFMNPFEAGKNFRETLLNLSTLGRGLQLPKETKDKYFLDDRLLDGEEAVGNPKSTGAYFSSSPLLQSNFNSKMANSLLQDYAAAEALETTAYIPEVLVVGATGEIGRLVVRRLLLEGRGRFRVRVLVRDLYSQTLNLLGTGVSYCQGDLNDVESLEYALTDVDKIVYVAGAPKPDESDFQQKFRWYLEEHDLKLSSSSQDNGSNASSKNAANNNREQLNDLEWEQLASVLEVRSELAEQVDCIGMKNLVSAYQNVRHTDYGTSQAAKRSLFKFSKKSGDFDLFALDDGDDDTDDVDDDDYSDGSDENLDPYSNEEHDSDRYAQEYNYDKEYDEDKYEDIYDEYNDEDYGIELESRNTKDTNVVKAQVRWLRNKFDNGVFVGRVPRADTNNPSTNPGGEASIISSKLQSREDPDQGIDMSNFAGFILRVVSDGNNYEAFVRTSLYETDGIEYVYEFSTESKRPTADNKSKNRFKTIRLAFENFKPIQRRSSSDDYELDDDDEDDILTVPPFDGSDVQYLGFRFRSSSNIREENKWIRDSLERFARGRNNGRDSEYQRFHMALSYIKVYRAQPEPEFIYLSDARIPPVIRDGMVQHQQKTLLIDDALAHVQSQQEQRPRNGSSSSNKKEAGDENDAAKTTTILDDKDLQRKSMLERSPQETYFKYRGEEILIKSGLSYTIIRVAGFNELSTSEASTIDLVQSNTETNIVPVSRAEAAQVCVSALLDPCALNKCVYMTKKSVAGKNVLDEEDISAKFEGIPTDVIL